MLFHTIKTILLFLGIVRVDLKSPRVKCKYRVALLVNPKINSQSDCEDKKFDENTIANQEIHTLEKIVCNYYNISKQGKHFISDITNNSQCEVIDYQIFSL